MDSPTDSSINYLAARATVKTYGNISIITIPDVETLSESEQIAVLKKAEQRLISGSLDANALRSRLQSITPLPDAEEDDEESRLLEAQVHKDLESNGCPACYPPHLDVPVQNPPEEYQPIIEYWQSFSLTGDVVLCAQRSDWRNFRASQQQSQQENWIEFQNYHLKYHEQLEKKRDKLKKELNDAQKKAVDTDIVGSEHAAQNEEAIQRRLEYTE